MKNRRNRMMCYNRRKKERTMHQDQMVEDFRLDDAGTPTGGTTRSVGIEIAWQDGPLVSGGAVGEPNGARVEGLIAAAVNRLRFYQSTRFSCRENEQTTHKLEEALDWLNRRSSDRQARGVKGTHEV